MSKGYCEKSELTAIADAIRTKTKKTDAMTLAQMPTEIENIKGGNEYTDNTLVVTNYTSGQIKTLIHQIDVSSLDAQNVTNMCQMFSGCSSLTSLNLSSLDAQKVTDMGQMFSGCGALTSLDLSNFNTSKVTNMNSMFYNCSNLASLDLSSFNTQNVTDMNRMFYYCLALTSLDLSSFNTRYVESMAGMFYNSWALASLDLSSFNTQNVTDMYQMFYNCSDLTSLTLGENWGINPSITSFDLSSCPLTHDSCLDVFNKLADKTTTITPSATLKLQSTSKALMSDEEIAIATAKGWTVS